MGFRAGTKTGPITDFPSSHLPSSSPSELKCPCVGAFRVCVCETTLYLARFLLICDRFLCVVLCFLHVVGRLFDVGFNLVHHLPLQQTKKKKENHNQMLFQTQTSLTDFTSVALPEPPPPWQGTGTCHAGL